MKELSWEIGKFVGLVFANALLVGVGSLWCSIWLFLPLGLAIVTDLSSEVLVLIGFVTFFVMIGVTMGVTEWLEKTGRGELPDWVWPCDPY